MPGGKAPKRRGDIYERELAKYLNDTVFNGRVVVSRAPLSGGGASFFSGGASDLLGLPHVWPEAKRTEKFSPYAAMAQAERGIAGRNCPDMPAVFTRRDHIPTSDSLVVMRLSDWTRLYAAYLAQEKS
jgi:hypothetical protein